VDNLDKNRVSPADALVQNELPSDPKPILAERINGKLFDALLVQDKQNTE
jgi:hypothetical protein